MAKSYNIIHTTVDGKLLNVKVKKRGGAVRRNLSPTQKTAISKMIASAKRRGKPVLASNQCTVIFFGEKKGKKVTAVQRCENRSTFKTKRWKDHGKKVAKKLCRDKKHRFRRCR